MGQAFFYDFNNKMKCNKKQILKQADFETNSTSLTLLRTQQVVKVTSQHLLWTGDGSMGRTQTSQLIPSLQPQPQHSVPGGDKEHLGHKGPGVLKAYLRIFVMQQTLQGSAVCWRKSLVMAKGSSLKSDCVTWQKQVAKGHQDALWNQGNV